jgi:serine/threonine protein kinase
VRLILDVLAAVAHAHAHLIVHRDIKPSNVLVTAEGQVKLARRHFCGTIGGGVSTQPPRAPLLLLPLRPLRHGLEDEAFAAALAAARLASYRV